MLTTGHQAATVFPRAHQDTGGAMDTHVHFVAPDLSDLLLDIGDRLGQLRHRRGLTQRDVGAAVGIAGAYVSLVEAGKREPSISTLANLTALYGGQFILEVRTSDAPRKLEDGKSSADLVWLKRAADILPTLDPQKREEILALMEFHAARATPAATASRR